MRCEAIEAPIGARAQRLACESCGCTEDNACPGGCYWASLQPPVCSQCADFTDDEPNAPRGSFFSEELCPASAVPAVHAPLYLDSNSGYCARCHLGFVT